MIDDRRADRAPDAPGLRSTIDIDAMVARAPGEHAGLPRTLIGWLTTTDHKAIGVAYAVTALVFLADRRGAGRRHPRRARRSPACRSSTSRPTTACSRSTAA